MDKPFLRIPAIGVSQPIGEFFLCSISAEVLLQVAYSIPATLKREGGMFSSIFGTQRIHSKQRAKQIGAYIDEERSTFPNSIILSVNYREDGEYEDDETLHWQAERGADGYSFLTIPKPNKLASIIDGQHRLDGFRYVEKQERLKMELPCAVYINLPRAYQARIFATININQKRVDKSLAYELFGYDLSESDSEKWPPDMLSVYLARSLEGSEESPFKGHVKLALLEEESDRGGMDGRYVKQQDQSWEISVACLVEGISRLISERPQVDRSALASGKVKDRSQLPFDGSPLRPQYLGGQDKSLRDLVIDYFTVVSETLWANRSEGSFITRTVGVLALFDVLKEGLSAGELSAARMRKSAIEFLANARGIDFSDNFFHASGAGRVRIRNVLRILTGLDKKQDDLVTVENTKRLIQERKI